MTPSQQDRPDSVLLHWRTMLDRALEENGDDPAARFFQLATVGLDGRPANRTVAFRGFVDGTDWPMVTTDARTMKAVQVTRDDRGEACWYFAETWEQFRLAGRVHHIGPDQPEPQFAQARRVLWAQIPERTQKRFFWPASRMPRASNDAFEIGDVDLSEPPESFVVLIIEPHEVDHLCLRPKPPERWLYTLEKNGEWQMRAVNP